MKRRQNTGKTKTHEKYVEELIEKNPDVEVIGIYCGAHIKIPHRCKKCGNVWDAKPSNILSGRGCPSCSKELYKKLYTKTTSEYIEELKNITDDIILIDEYVNAKTPVTHYCKRHDVYWKTAPTRVLQGCGCPECSKEKIANALKKTTLEYTNELEEKNKHIIPLEEYINVSTPILHKCLVCQFEWKAKPFNILQNNDCPNCSGIQKKTTEIYKEELKEVNPNVIPLEDYIGAREPIKHLCLIHNFEWVTSPTCILRGCGCPECSKEKISKALKKTKEQYMKELEGTGKNIILIDDYIDALTPVMHKCTKCGTTWKASPGNILYSTGCPHCNISKGESVIEKWLISKNISYESQKRFPDCKDKKTLPFDFYLPDYNKAIEFDGEQHYKPIKYFGGEKRLEYLQKHDKIKDDFCKENGIPLLRIPYNKFNNIEEELNNFIFI